MPVMSGSAAGTAVGSGDQVPFVVGSNYYSEKFATDTIQPGSAAVEFVHNITPGGFLRGVELIVSASGGVLGAGALAADMPWISFSSISLENIDGSPILYPMTGYAVFLDNKYCRPWQGDPGVAKSFSNTVNPAFALRLYPEVRDTLGVLANTDARAQYRIRYTVNTSTSMFSTAPTTVPTLTIEAYMDSWAQTDPQDLHGNPIAPTPDGLSCAHIVRHQILTLNGAGADNTFQLTNTGNELRNVIAVIRDSNGARQDYFSDPIRIRLDNRALDVIGPDKTLKRMEQFYPFLADGSSGRETGVYCWPRFRRPGDLTGNFWMGTSNATYLIFETSTPNSGLNLPGTVEWITDEVVPVSPVPVELEGI